jgi:signal peptidase II
LNDKTRRWVFLFLLIGLIVVADQVTKRLVVDNLSLGETQRLIPALSPFFQITHSKNTGAAFGFIPQAGDLFLIISIIVVIAMLFYYPRIAASSQINRIATGLICGGALGNAIDRLTYGHVVDFIHYQIPGLISNVSNIADHAIVFGVLLLFFESWRSERVKNRLTAETPAEGT